MATRKIAMGTAVGALAAGMVVAPASAHDNGQRAGGPWRTDGTAVKFSNEVRRALKDNDVRVDAVPPAKAWNAVMFTFPAERTDRTAVSHSGGLTFTYKGSSTTVSDVVFDLEAKTVDVTISGKGAVDDAFSLQRVRYGKKIVKADVTVADGKAATLNAAVGTDVFRDGMSLAATMSRFGSKGW